jgi:hypothetical protein
MRRVWEKGARVKAQRSKFKAKGSSKFKTAKLERSEEFKFHPSP